MQLASRSDEISILLNVDITIMKALIRDILELGACDLQIFLYKVHPTLDGYGPYDASRRVIQKNIENITN